MTGIASKLIRSCGCVVHRDEAGVFTHEWCAEHAKPAAVDIKPGAVTTLAEDLAALRRALGVAEDAATEEMVMAALGMRESVRELEHAKCGDVSALKGPTDV